MILLIIWLVFFQLRVRDLEGVLEVEKSVNDEVNKVIDRLIRQIRELEQSYEEERKNNKDVNIKLDKVEKEYSFVKRQLTLEVENKKNVIGNLSKELEVYQKNFNELKDELFKVSVVLLCFMIIEIKCKVFKKCSFKCKDILDREIYESYQCRNSLINVFLERQCCRVCLFQDKFFLEIFV